MRPHELSPDHPTSSSSQNQEAQSQEAQGERTSLGLIVVWLVVAAAVVYFGFLTLVAAAFTASMTDVPVWAGWVTFGTMVAVTLIGGPLSLWHFALVCSRRPSRTRTRLATLQAVYVPLYFFAGWALTLYAENYANVL